MEKMVKYKIAAKQFFEDLEKTLQDWEEVIIETKSGRVLVLYGSTQVLSVLDRAIFEIMQEIEDIVAKMIQERLKELYAAHKFKIKKSSVDKDETVKIW